MIQSGAVAPKQGARPVGMQEMGPLLYAQLRRALAELGTAQGH